MSIITNKLSIIINNAGSRCNLDKWHNYTLYGINVKINQKIPGIISYIGNSIHYTITVNFSSINNDNISIKMDKDIYTIQLYKYAIIKINNSNKTIEWNSPDYIHFISTFFNIPFSVLSLLNNQCLLHTSVLINNNELYAFCAKQGVGKSTLCYLLNDNEYKYFSDDTLNIDTTYNGIKGSEIIKLTNDSIKLRNKSNSILYENINNKKCVLLNEKFDGIYPIKYLFIMERINSNLKINEVSNSNEKRLLLYDHIVGVNYFNSELFRLAMRFIETSRVGNIKMYKLFVPDNYLDLSANIQKLRKIIIDLKE